VLRAEAERILEMVRCPAWNDMSIMSMKMTIVRSQPLSGMR
jgi:hypothetical protein